MHVSSHGVAQSLKLKVKAFLSFLNEDEKQTFLNFPRYQEV